MTKSLSKEVEDLIIGLHIKENMSHKEISIELDIPQTTVRRFLIDYKLKNYSDENVEKIARVEDYSPMTLFDLFFDSIGAASKEMAMNSIISSMIREEIAEVLSKQGINGLMEESNVKLMSAWEGSIARYTKLSANIPKQLDAYISYVERIFDLNRDIALLKVTTEILKRKDPKTHAEIKKAIQQDPAGKALMNAVSTRDIVAYYQDDYESIPVKVKRLQKEEEYEGGE